MKRLYLYGAFMAALTQTAHFSQAALLEYTAAHADIRPVYENGELSLRWRFDSNAVLNGVLNPSPALIAPPDAYARVPNSTIATPSEFSALFSFFPSFFQSIGQPTDPFWILPQNNVSGLPFLGFSTEELVSSDWGPTVDIELSNFSGPGHFTLYKNGFGPTVQLSTADDVDSFSFFQGHDHYNWAFLKAGVYELEFTITGTHTTDGVRSATDSFTFAVGDSTPIPEPSTLALVFGALAGVFAVARKKRAVRSSRRLV